MKGGLWIAVAVVAIALLAVGGCLVGQYNRLVTKDQSVKGAWAEVDNQLQRRSDLIGNLVETVKGVATQEQVVFGEIARARAALSGARTPAQGIEAGRAMDSALSRLLVVIENYPQLRSNEQFAQLMDEIAGTENRLAVARNRYNLEAQGFNTMIKVFPANLFAGMMGFQPAPFYPVSDAARERPNVDFGSLRPDTAGAR
jgi:LemA protein